MSKLHINKTDLVKELSNETQFSPRDIKRVLGALAGLIQRTLTKRGKILWSGLGVFSTAERSERPGINPSTRERIILPATVVPKFRAGKHLKKFVQSGR